MSAVVINFPKKKAKPPEIWEMSEAMYYLTLGFLMTTSLWLGVIWITCKIVEVSHPV